MAYSKRRRATTRVRRRRGSKFTKLEVLAYNIGRIDRGRQNSNSRVHESYNNGLKGQTTTKKKPLI